MNICESLTVTANLLPDNIALVAGEQRVTYRQLDALSSAAAIQLQEAGIKPGERVAIMLPNTPAFPVWYYAALRIGAIAVSVSTRLAPPEVEYVASDCHASVFVGSEMACKLVASALPDCVTRVISVNDSGHLVNSNSSPNTLDESAGREGWYEAEPDTPALILYTSGTTGFPKGATLSHNNVRSNVHAFNHLCNMQSHDRVLLAVPLFHCFGQNALLNSVLNVGGTLVLQQGFDLNESRRLIAEHQITQLYGVPMMFGLLLDYCSPDELKSVKYCFSAAASLPIQTSLAWQQKFSMPIHEGYGLTETSPFASYNHRIKFTPGSIGMPIDSVEIKIADTETGETCPPGRLGEIAIRGPNVMLGYWNRAEETANAIRDGWFHSGDIGRMDEQGFLYIVDRVKDMIAVGGLKVFPAEVERVLLDHPEVLQAAVIGVPDPMLGEQVLAYLVIDQASDEATVIEQVNGLARKNLGSYKVPRRLLVVDELPRNPSGKVLKTKLREMAVDFPKSDSSEMAEPLAIAANLKPASLRQQLADSYDSEKNRIAVTFLQNHIQSACELDEVPDPRSSFMEAGLDSLAMVELGAQLQVETGPGQTLPPTLLFDHPRIIDLASFLVDTLDKLTGTPSDEADHGSSSVKVDRAAGSRSRDEMRDSVLQMSEEEALAELMKELD